MIPRPPRSTLFPYTRSSDLTISPPGGTAIGGAPPPPCPALAAPPGLTPPRPQAAPITRTARPSSRSVIRSEEHTSELQSHSDLVCRLLLEKKNKNRIKTKQN